MAWANVGNIKGPQGDPGAVTGIPDPLTLNVMTANNTLNINGKLRIVTTSTGGQVETFDGTSWTVQQAWP
jgi:hypothetical protein